MSDTDKLQTGLMEVYRELFAGLRNQPVSLLEIGIDKGGSLLLWTDYFSHPRAAVVGIDLNLPAGPFPANVFLYACDQNDAAGLRAIAERHGPFDIIIDDGSHFTSETRNCFSVLFEASMKVGGWYVIEDWAVGYWRERDRRFRGMVELVTDMIERAPGLSISEFTVSLKPGQAYAGFRKGEAGWTA